MKGGGSGRRSYTKYTAPITEGGGTYGSKGGGGKGTDCGSIRFSTKLVNVLPTISGVVAGNVLVINKVRGAALGAFLDGVLCGHISSTNNAKLLECIDKGFAFKATVINISGKICQVLVEADL